MEFWCCIHIALLFRLPNTPRLIPLCTYIRIHLSPTPPSSHWVPSLLSGRSAEGDTVLKLICLLQHWQGVMIVLRKILILRFFLLTLQAPPTQSYLYKFSTCTPLSRPPCPTLPHPHPPFFHFSIWSNKGFLSPPSFSSSVSLPSLVPYSSHHHHRSWCCQLIQPPTLTHLLAYHSLLPSPHSMCVVSPISDHSRQREWHSRARAEDGGRRKSNTVVLSAKCRKIGQTEDGDGIKARDWKSWARGDVREEATISISRL